MTFFDDWLLKFFWFLQFFVFFCVWGSFKGVLRRTIWILKPLVWKLLVADLFSWVEVPVTRHVSLGVSVDFLLRWWTRVRHWDICRTISWNPSRWILWYSLVASIRKRCDWPLSSIGPVQITHWLNIFGRVKHIYLFWWRWAHLIWSQDLLLHIWHSLLRWLNWLCLGTSERVIVHNIVWVLALRLILYQNSLLLILGRWSQSLVWKIYIVDVLIFFLDTSDGSLISHLTKSCIQWVFSISSKIFLMDFGSDRISDT